MSDSPVLQICLNIVLFGAAAGVGMAGFIFPIMLVDVAGNVVKTHFEDWRDQRRRGRERNGDKGATKENHVEDKVQ